MQIRRRWLLLLPLWVSVPVAAAGTHLMSMSPRHSEYFIDTIERADQASPSTPGRDNLPGIAVGAAAASAWPFVAAFHFGLALITTLGVAIVPELMRWSRQVAWIVIAFGALMCALFAWALARDAMMDAGWGFDTRALGSAISSLGLLMAMVAAVLAARDCRKIEDRSHLRPLLR